MTALRLTNISKHFGAIHALSDVSLSLEPAQVLGLMGDNGAGKSTLVKIIAGNFPPTGGSIHIADEEVHFSQPIDARRNGIEIVYQDLALCNNLTAGANVFLGRELRKGWGPFKILDYKQMYARAGELFAELKSETRARDLVRQMSGGQRQAVAIARAVYFNARILIMDEPTAALGPAETAQVRNLVRQLKDEGIGIFLISHDIHDVFDLSDRISVMYHGRIVDTVEKASVTPDDVLAMIILGKKPDEVTEKDKAAIELR